MQRKRIVYLIYIVPNREGGTEFSITLIIPEIRRALLN